MIKKIVYGVLILLGVGLLFFYFFQERFIFLNGKKLAKDFVYQFPQTFQEINITTQDNETLNALHFTQQDSKGVILFFHGNKGNLERWGAIVPYLLDYGYDVLVMDYRNYGKSTGSFDEAKMYEDALTVYDHLKDHYTEEQIVVYGRSLGATFASHVGANRNPKHVVLEAPFYNLKRATRNFFILAPTFLLKYKLPSDKIVPKISVPVTFFHGDDDGTTSFEESKELFELVGSQQKEFVAIPTGTHHNLKDFDLYKQKLQELLK
ncbi:alpha/beta hydrolase [Pseudotenacibaculum haliotis]|uniref:Alpha/beta hydrolase n=1 Tax=Pseudotenacibaculum haliotis TaxID=1862138 RepID=A0ABW5LWY7_9FLAO